MHRRDFLKRSAGAAVATVAGPSLAAAAIPEAAATPLYSAVMSVGYNMGASTSWDSVATSTPLADFRWVMSRIQADRDMITEKTFGQIQFEPMSVSEAEKTRTRLADLGFEEAK